VTAISYILIIVLGAALGSFFNVVIYRLPHGQSIVRPASRCPGCGLPIKPWRNIPILSWLLLRGRCPDCDMRIHWHYLLVEVVTPLLFAGLFFMNGSMFTPEFGKWAIFFGVSLVIFFIDAFHQIIPDVLSLPLIVVGLLIALLPETGVSIISSAVGGGFAFLLFFGLGTLYEKVRKVDGLGGGDVKYMAAVGAFVGFPGILFVMLASAVLAVLFFLVMRLRREQPFPFGPFIVLGSLLYVLAGEPLISWYTTLLPL